jgi:hypothetical protein
VLENRWLLRAARTCNSLVDVMVAIASYYLVKLMFQTRKTKAVKWPGTTFYPLEKEYI